MAGILRITTATPQLPSQKNMKNIVDDIIKKTIDDDLQETITVTFPDHKMMTTINLDPSRWTRTTATLLLIND